MPILNILSDSEIRLYNRPPKFNKADRQRFFLLTPDVKRRISHMKTKEAKVGFVLQLGYFKASGRFYQKDDFKKLDINFVNKLLRSNVSSLHFYNSTIISRHRQTILNLLNWQEPGPDDLATLIRFSQRLASNQLTPKTLLKALMDKCWEQQWVVPSYYELSKIVSDSFNTVEQDHLHYLQQSITSIQFDALYTLLNEGKTVNGRRQPKITYLKKINQSIKPGAIKNNIELVKLFKAYFQEYESIFDAIEMTDQAIEYYANWFMKADYQQITQFPDKNKQFMLLLAFIKQQYYKRNDALIDSYKKSITSAKHSVKAQLDKDILENHRDRNKAYQLLNQSHKNYRAFAESVITIVQSDIATPNEKYYQIESLVDDLDSLDSEQDETLQKLDEFLNKQSRNKNYYDLLEQSSRKLQLRVSGIIKVMEFDRETSLDELIKVIDYYKQQDGRVDEKAPIEFLDSEEEAVVFKDNQFNSQLYKSLLFIRIDKAIKARELNVKHSFRYRALQDYLIDSKDWAENTDYYLKEANLSQFADGEAYLEHMSQQLDEAYHQVNQNHMNNNNPYLTVSPAGKPSIRTPSIEVNNKEFISDTLTNNGYIPILALLQEINQVTDFTSQFQHFNVKNVKMKPTDTLLLAGIIGKGCNIGINKLANISSGVKEHKLRNAVKWFFELQNIQQANKKVIDTIHGLQLANNYLSNSNVIHSSSDGRKVTVAVDSLMANRSFKYFGQEQGVTMYTFIDERQSIFYSTVFSSSDREAAYVIDGLLNNEVPEYQIHSTDTHGYTEQIFAATHLIGVDFAPRIKKVNNQKIYSFSAKRTYQKKGYKILPSRTINKKLILKHWDDILRFMATITLHKTTASQLFTRFNSYSSSNSLYKAFKEFGRIIKSKFILTYYDDVQLRQQIQKQLNRVELSNKFAHAVFFDNDQAFQDGEPDEQEISTACQVLIQNCIILWNYLYLSNLIISTTDKEMRLDLIEAITQGSVITWQHVNLRGEYDFRKRASNDSKFDMKKIRNLKL